MDKKIFKVLELLNKKGYEAYFVGGFPRDLYMGKETIDYDITTNATPKEIMEIFDNIKSDNYGCVKFEYEGNNFEATTYRKDIKYKDNRKPIVIEYINDLKIDILRRDFTMNTLCLNSKGEYIDYLNGKDDIDNKIIKVVGNTNKKIKEDALRILRAIRFATTLNFKLSKELENAIKEYGYLVRDLSYNRKKEELDKIFASNNFDYGISLIRNLGLEQYLEINTYNIKKTTYLVGVWAQLNASNYNFNKSEQETIKNVKELLDKDILSSGNLYKYGLYVASIAAEIKGIDVDLVNKKYNDLKIKSRNEIAITPVEICEVVNEKPGSFLNIVLSDLEDKIINEELINEKEEIIPYLIENYL